MVAGKGVTFGDVGNLVLLIGDLHIPERKAKLPQCFEELLATDKIDSTLSTGNFGSLQAYDLVKGMSRSLWAVQGNNEAETVKRHVTADTQKVKIGQFQVGLIHGHQILPWGSVPGLQEWQRRLDCDILVHGHTHESSIVEVDGSFFVNPGSGTGAMGVTGAERSPSFMLMAIAGENAIIYTYEEKNGQANVVMSEFNKRPGQIPSLVESFGNLEIDDSKPDLDNHNHLESDAHHLSPPSLESPHSDAETRENDQNESLPLDSEINRHAESTVHRVEIVNDLL